jgi:MoaA/NifB/PqqE/SkfB family radical SAM enzyme
MTGGEGTLRYDFLDLVSFAKDTLHFENISVITNGSRFCDERFAEEAIRRGVDDVIVSIHGHDPALHDHLVDRKGSFDEVVLAVRNILKFGASCRSNTVVNNFNFKHSSDIANTLYGFGIKRINYILFSPLDEATATQKNLWVRYSDAAPFIKQMIDRFSDKFEAISIKVIPFCFLEGYTDYVTNFWQNLYDPYEWDFFNRVRIRRGLGVRNIAVLSGLILFMDLWRMMRIGFRKSMYEALARVQSFRECTKPQACRLCKYDKVCPGVWKDYAQTFGVNEIVAVPGKKIRDVDFSIIRRFGNFYQKK